MASRKPASEYTRMAWYCCSVASDGVEVLAWMTSTPVKAPVAWSLVCTSVFHAGVDGAPTISTLSLHEPPLHTPSGQMLPQPPQLLASVLVFSSQPLAMLLSQLANGALHE